MTDETESTELTVTGAAKPPVLNVGGNVSAIAPQNLDDFFRLARAMHMSGMAPQTLNTPEKVMVAIMAGAELGLPAFQSIQSFAVINGRPSIWGDGMLAVVRSRGFRVREWMEGEDDDRIAYCEVTRPDTGETIKRSFSVAQAKQARLWDKTGPWQTNPDRMLQMRARAFSCRDGAADVLRGFQMREEVEDYVTHGAPAKSGLRDRLEANQAPSTEGFTVENGEHLTGDKLDEILDGDNFPITVQPEEEQPRPKRKYTRRAAENSPAAAEQGDPSPQTITDVSAETVTGNGDTDAEDEQRLEETTLSPVTSDDSLAEDDFPGDRALAAPDVEEAPDATLPEYGPDEELYRDVIHAATNLKAVANAITLFKQSEVFQAAEPSEQRAWQLLAHLKIEQLTKTDSTIAHPAHGLWRFSQWVSAGHPGGNVRETYEALKKTEAYGKTTAGQREALEHMVAVAEHENAD